MIGSLNAGVTGLNAFTEAISVISNNISNVETTAYKSSSISFADTLNSALTGISGESVGTGVKVQDVAESWNQGNISTTGESTDIAINGSGFFIVQDRNSGACSYTRDGSFSFDKNGNLVNDDGMIVQGYVVNDDGTLGSLSDVEISYEAFPPSATTEMSTTLNIDSGEETGGTFSTTTTVYDSLGNEIPITITYTKSANNNEWEWAAEISSEYGTLGGDASGTLVFDESGALTAGSDPVFILGLTNGADPSQSISWDLYDDSGNTNDSLTQYSSSSALYDQGQDGYAPGDLNDVSINEDGVIVGSYSNGETQELYQIAMASFADYSGLEKVGDNLYRATVDSGQAVVGVPGTGQLGTVSSGGLEMSNVDLASEMANLITAQRAYQSCARVFTVTSEILQTLVNLK